MFTVDAMIILTGFFIFGAKNALYAVVAAFISSKAVDTALEGLSFSRAAVIISDRNDEIASEIMEKLGRGVTAFDGKGMFTGDKKKVLLCVFGNKEIVTVKEIVRFYDKNAFIIVTDVKEVMGEGFADMDTDM